MPSPRQHSQSTVANGTIIRYSQMLMYKRNESQTAFSCSFDIYHSFGGSHNKLHHFQLPFDDLLPSLRLLSFGFAVGLLSSCVHNVSYDHKFRNEVLPMIKEKYTPSVSDNKIYLEEINCQRIFIMQMSSCSHGSIKKSDCAW